jgi:hypothetical protein
MRVNFLCSSYTVAAHIKRKENDDNFVCVWQRNESDPKFTRIKLISEAYNESGKW